jgi:hypothetical protein
MKWLIRFTFTIIVSCAFAYILSRIPGFQAKASEESIHKERLDFSVFGQQRDSVLNDRNLVDFIQELPLQLKIAKIDIGQTILSIDLLVQHPDREKDSVYEDLYDIPNQVFAKTGNIDRVFVRIMQEESDNKGAVKDYLLLAMDAGKQDVRPKEQEEGRMSTLSMEQFVRSHFRLTETDRWNSMRINAR